MIELTLAMAEKAVRAAQEKAKALGTPMTITVVDEAGRLVLSARGDGTGFFTPDTSRGKAVAATAFRRATGEMGKMIEDGTAFWNVIPTALRGEILPTNGGVPITKGGKVIGGIGCGGGSGEQDHECAVAGAQALAG
jgi:uncharacterized protein GlcG (DUF336 family)